MSRCLWLRDRRRSWSLLVDRDRASNAVSRLPRHVRGRARHACAGPVRGVDGPLEGVTECGRVALLDAVEDDLVRLHDVVDVESQVPYSGAADNSRLSRAARSRDQRRLGQPDNRTRTRTPVQPSGSGSPRARLTI